MKVLIVGLGLIGGSMAKAVKEKTEHLVIGFDADPCVMEKALQSGAVDSIMQDGTSPAEMILLALYPEAIVEFVRRHRDSFAPGCMIVDLCGVKRYVCDEVGKLLEGRDVIFIGGHPMAGMEASGFDYARANLFEGASMILTPDEAIQEKTLAQAKDFFLRLGFGGVTVTTPEHHDEMIALTSQLAHVVSSAYAQDPNAERHAGFSAGSFRDMTRVAKLHEGMWSELFVYNADYLADMVGSLIKRLEAFEAAVRSRDREALRVILKSGREIKERLLAAETKK